MNDETRIPKLELTTNDKCRSVVLRHSNFVIPLSFVIRASSFLIIFLSVSEPAFSSADNLGVLGSKPKWEVLEHYQRTIAHDDFARLINGVYCTHGIPDDLIKIDNDSARILTNRESQHFFELHFAPDQRSCARVPRLW